MRVLLRSILLGALVVSGSRAWPVDCPGPTADPPTGVTAAIEDASNAQGAFKTVRVGWTHPAYPNDGRWFFLAFRVERRDVTSGGTFEKYLQVQTGINPGSRGSVFDPVEEPGGQFFLNPVFPGRTYEFRVVTVWRWGRTCDQYDGLEHDSEPSLPVEIQIPGGADPPRDLIAVAHPRKPQVGLTWKPPATGTVDGYVIERRRIDTAPGAKFEADFHEIARLGPLLKFVDRKVESGGEYEYVVGTLVAQELLFRSRKDRAHTAGRCSKSTFSIWRGSWTPRDPGLGDVLFTVGAGASLEFLVSPQSGVPDPTPFLQATATGAGKAHGLPAISLNASLERPAGVFTGLAAEARGRLGARMVHGDPFSDGAWATAQVELAFAKKALAFEMDRDFDEPLSTTVCGTIGAGKRKSDTAAVGEPVVFLFQLVALGPHPLLAGELRLLAELEGGTFVNSIGGNFVRAVNDGVGQTTATYDVGALGPTRIDRSEVATVAFSAAANAVPSDGQLRLRVHLLDVGNDRDQVLQFTQAERVAEVRIVP